MSEEQNKIPDYILKPLRAAQGQGTVAWTPSEELVQQVVDHFLDTIEPGWFEATVRRDPALYRHMNLEKEDLARFLGGKNKEPITFDTLKLEGKLNDTILNTIKAEVKTYQGLHAIAFHRVAHALYNQAMAEKETAGQNPEKEEILRSNAASNLLLARQISQGVRRLTAGIEIHPGAEIGKNFFIDHGASVVIGETCKIGKDVFIYHGVTLGAASGQEIDEGKAIPRRHPQIGDGTVISTGVNILGPVSIGSNVSIGADALIIGSAKTNVDGKIIGNIEIGDGANIRPRVEITHNIPKGAIVVGSLPNIPGIYGYDKEHPEESLAGKPILQPRRNSPEENAMNAPDTSLLPLREWFGKLAEYVEKSMPSVK